MRVITLVTALALLATPIGAQTRTAPRTPARRAAPKPPPLPPLKTEPAMIVCPNPLGEGVQTKQSFCDVLTGRDPADGILVDIPPHVGPVTISFDLHNRHMYSEELIKSNRAYRRYTATIGVLTMDNTLVSRAVVQSEFRRASDLVDRIGGGAGPGGVKAVAPTGSEPISIQIPETEQRVSVLGEKLAVERLDGVDSFTLPGQPVAIISNVMLEVQACAAEADAGAQTQVNSRPELLSIIVPVYNEVRTVLAVIDRLRAIDLPVAREILVVNDGSTDGTRDVLTNPGIGDQGSGIGTPERGTSRSAIPDPRSRPVTVIHAERNAGKGAAIRLGLDAARGTIVAIQDADLELDPQQLSALVTPILRGEADVVYGSRFLAGRPAAPWITIAANRALTATTNILFGSSITDMETCYKIMRADVARSLKLDANRFDIEPQITARLLAGGYRIHELPVTFEPRSRAQGKKIGWRDGIRAIEVLVKERFR